MPGPLRPPHPHHRPPSKMHLPHVIPTGAAKHSRCAVEGPWLPTLRRHKSMESPHHPPKNPLQTNQTAPKNPPLQNPPNPLPPPCPLPPLPPLFLLTSTITSLPSTSLSLPAPRTFPKTSRTRTPPNAPGVTPVAASTSPAENPHRVFFNSGGDAHGERTQQFHASLFSSCHESRSTGHEKRRSEDRPLHE